MSRITAVARSSHGSLLHFPAPATLWEGTETRPRQALETRPFVPATEESGIRILEEATTRMQREIGTFLQTEEPAREVFDLQPHYSAAVTIKITSHERGRLGFISEADDRF
jgi:hypothetical protein